LGGISKPPPRGSLKRKINELQRWVSVSPWEWNFVRGSKFERWFGVLPLQRSPMLPHIIPKFCGGVLTVIIFWFVSSKY
jgi:hypothetical protein